MRRSLLSTVAFVLLMARAFGHHSFAAEFDENKRVKVSGVVAKLEWTNPHAWLYVDAKDGSGETTRWRFEMGSPNMLVRQGWRQTAVKAGDHVTVEGYAAKDGSNMANARSVLLSDGTKIFSGTRSGVDGPPN